ncbi:hypothetical protein Droror1_Dr00022194 [Drosera rotundifolia]
MDMYTDEELSITITGHSPGAALAIISAYDIAETGLHIRQDGQAVPVCVFSYSGPRVGNYRFKEQLEGLGVKVLRVVNVHDMMPKTPGFFITEHTPRELSRMSEGFLWSYFHVGEELVLDHKNSPFLKDTNDPECSHNLEALLHLLDGHHGRGKRFVLSSERGFALANKECDFLKDHYEIPPCWRQDENKGMLKGKDGRWMQAERPRHDDQPEDMHHHLAQSSLLPGHRQFFHISITSYSLNQTSEELFIISAPHSEREDEKCFCKRGCINRQSYKVST